MKVLNIYRLGSVHSATGRMALPKHISELSKLNAPAIGNLRSYGVAFLNDNSDAVDMTRFSRVLSFDAETGI